MPEPTIPGTETTPLEAIIDRLEELEDERAILLREKDRLEEDREEF